MATYNYTKSVNVGILETEIRASAIVTALDYITALGTAVSVVFKGTLSSGDESLLTTIVTNHVNVASPQEAELVTIIAPIKQYALAEGDTLRARLIGFINQTVTKNQSTTLDWAIPQLTYLGVNKSSYMDGINYYAKNASVGDKMTFQVIDKDNVMGYGTNTVLDEFGKDWAVMPNFETTIRLYKARLIPGLYIRVIYTSVGTTDDVSLVCNLFRHMETV